MKSYGIIFVFELGFMLILFALPKCSSFRSLFGRVFQRSITSMTTSMMMTSQAEADAAFYWHVWTDEDGLSRTSKRSLSSGPVDVQSFLSQKADKWSSRPMQLEGTQVVFINLQPGKVLDWHENPKPQWIIPIKGSWFVETTMDGVKTEMGPGQLSLGEDQNTIKTVDGKFGHRSGALGDEPAVLMLIQYENRTQL